MPLKQQQHDFRIDTSPLVDPSYVNVFDVEDFIHKQKKFFFLILFGIIKLQFGILAKILFYPSLIFFDHIFINKKKKTSSNVQKVYNNLIDF